MTLRYVNMLSAAVAYKEDLIALGKATTTIEARCGRKDPHGGHIGRLVAIAGDNTLVRDLSREHVNSLFSEAKSTGDFNNMLVNIRGFLAFCKARQYISENRVKELMEGRKTKSWQRDEKIYLTVQQYDKALMLLGDPDHSFTVGDKNKKGHPQRRAALAIAWNTCLRQSEITGMKMQDLRPAEHELRVWREKQDEFFSVPTHPGFERELYGIWLPYYAREAGYGSWEEMASDHPDWPVLPRLQMYGRDVVKIVPGKPYKSGIEAIAKETLAVLGIKSHGGDGMHMFRRSSARCLFKIWAKMESNDQALVRVQQMLGHKSIVDTMKYIGYDKEKEELMTVVKASDPFDALREAAPVLPMPEPEGVVSLAAFKARRGMTAV